MERLQTKVTEHITKTEPQSQRLFLRRRDLPYHQSSSRLYSRVTDVAH